MLSSSTAPCDPGLPRHLSSPEKEFPEAWNGVGKGQDEQWHPELPSQLHPFQSLWSRVLESDSLFL